VFSLSPLKYPPGVELVVLWNVAIALHMNEFVRFPTPTTVATFWIDYGDGNEATDSGDEGDDVTFTHTYTGVGVLTLRVLVQYGSSDVREKFSWTLQVGADVADFVWTEGGANFLPAALATFDLPQGRRHIVSPMPDLIAGPPPPEPPPPPTPAQFMAGLEVLLRQFQFAFANGFGRIPAPTEALVRGITLYTLGDALVAGTNTALQASLADVEEKLRIVQEDPSRADAMAVVKVALDGLQASVTSLQDLTRINLTGGNILVPGRRTVRYWDVLDWRAFVNSGIDENQSLGTVPVEDWRKFLGKLDRPVPAVNWTTAWEWTLVQALIQCIQGMYTTFGLDANTMSGYVSALPGIGAMSLRLYDTSYNFWVQATLAPSGPSGMVSLRDMIDDGAGVAIAGGSHVAARVAGVLDQTQTDVLHVFDVAHVEDALRGVNFADVPSITTLTNPTGISVFREVTGSQSSQTLGPDGSSYTQSVTDAVAVATVASPALALPGLGDNWSALDPVAALAILHGPGRM
jgi:hypothetical protein